MTDYDSCLSPLQLQGAEWLRERPRRMLADAPGFGKTRTILAAIGERPTLVVCPAGIRDAGVWEGEAARTGWGADLHVISYHQLARWNKDAPKRAFELGVEGVVFDESHWLKNRKVSWAHGAQRLSDTLEYAYEATGTPTPNVASELWGQLRVLRGKDGIPAFWRWASGNIGDREGWFHISTDFDRGGNVLTSHAIHGHLESCVVAGCHNGEPDLRPDPKTGQVVYDRFMPVTALDCEHWAEFRRIEQAPWMLARSEELLDLPPMSGEDTPIWTPMTPGQKRAYKELQRDYLTWWTDARGNDQVIEAVSDSQKFVNLWQMSTGVGAVDPTADDRDSGKLKMIAEMLEDRQSQTLIACYFRNTGQILQNVCRRVGKTFVTFGAMDTAAQRRDAVRAFQNNEVDVMIGSIAVVGEGLTLTAADGVWLAERMWTPDKNTQVIRRVRRRGQDRPVGVRQFITPGTIDEGQWGMLHQKIDRISQVDPVRLSYGEVVLR